jgi:hypothetical protein
MSTEDQTNQQLRHILGDQIQHVPAWMYVQDQGAGLVSFVGSSRAQTGAHPMRYGSGRSHQFILGEVVIRPHLIVGTDTLRGQGAGGLVTGSHDIDQMLREGEVILDITGRTQPLDKY